MAKEGNPIGAMIMVLAKQVKEDYKCSICQDDGGADPEQCIRKSLIWPG